MGLFKKSGSFGSAIGSAISKVFGGGNAAKTHAVAKKYGGQPPPEAVPVKSQEPFLTTEDYRRAMEQAAQETSAKIDADIARRFGTSAPPDNKSDDFYDQWREELAKEAREDMRRKARWIEEQHQHMGKDQQFLYGELAYLISSNVNWTQYDLQRHLLYINYHNGATYVYYEVPPNVALGLLNAPSPGGYVWDIFRVRKTVWGYKYNYAFLEYSLGGYQPRYMSDEGYQKEHAAIPPSGEPPAGWKIAGSGPYADLPWYTRSPGKEAEPHQLPTAKIFEEPEQPKQSKRA